MIGIAYVDDDELAEYVSTCTGVGKSDEHTRFQDSFPHPFFTKSGAIADRFMTDTLE